MISGDSTASHMGSVKNIEKARERRTFDTMPGSTSTGVPEDLLAHSESVHPRMGYDMSDSIFMQEMQAAGRNKESKRALEERSALEAFRAAALQKPFDPSAASSTKGRPRDGGQEGAGAGSSGGGGSNKPKTDAPPPLAVIRLKKRSSAEAPPKEGGKGEHGAHADGGHTKKKKKSTKSKSKSKRSRTGSEDGAAAGRGGGGAVEREGGEAKGKESCDKGEAAGPGLGLGLVAYSSGSDGESEPR